MPLRIKPFNRFRLKQGSQVPFTLDMVDHLDGDTVASVTMAIIDAQSQDVTSNFSGGYSEASGVISFGIKAYATGAYTITFTVICNEVLPDGVTPRKFYPILRMRVI